MMQIEKTQLLAKYDAAIASTEEVLNTATIFRCRLVSDLPVQATLAKLKAERLALLTA